MELFTGECGICSSRSLILNSDCSENYCNLIYNHFGKELNVSSESKTNFNLCPMCVYHITLIDSKKNSLVREYVEDEMESIDKCALCKQNGDIFKIADTSFLNKCKQWMSAKDIVSLCASCYYIIELNNVLKEQVMRKLFVKDASTDNQNCLPIQRTIMKRRKSSTGLAESSVIVSEDINSEYNSSETKKRRKKWNVTNLNDSVDTTVVRPKRKRSKDLGELLDEHLENLKLKRSKISEWNFEELQVESFDLDLPSISHLSPLCKLGIDIDEEQKQDKKMYNCIPFVKMQNSRETSVKKDDCNYVCSLISQKPIIQVSRTPPIKIKTIRNVRLTKDKKNVPGKRGNKSSMVNVHSLIEIPEQKLVVKVERMKLDIPKEEITPKKKKRVHFNDIPTIIFTDDDYYADCKLKRNTKILSNPHNTGIIEIIDDETKKIEEEKSDSEELITLSLDESDDESQADTVIECNEENAGEISINNTNEPQVLEDSVIIDDQSEKLDESEEINGETDEFKDCEESSVKTSQEDGDASSVKTSQEDGEESSVKTSQEDGEYEEDSLVECEIINSQEENFNPDSVEKTCYNKNIDQEDEGLCDKFVGPNSSNQIIDQEEVSSDKLIEMTSTNQIIDLQEGESSDKLVKTASSNEIIDIQEDGESSDKSVSKTPLTERIVLDEESSPKFTENINKDLEKKDLEDEEKENSDTKQLLKDSDTEKDSLDGFEVIDQEDGDVIIESREKVSSDKQDESADNIDAIDDIVKKYCGEKDTNSEGSKNDVSETERKIEETVLDSGETSSQEKRNEEKSGNKQSSDQENESAEEDFGSLIDEVQKCLTSTKDLLDKSEETTEDQCEDSEPNTKEKADILKSSCDENHTNTPNSTETESLNGNKGLKRKDSDENIVGSD